MHLIVWLAVVNTVYPIVNHQPYKTQSTISVNVIFKYTSSFIFHHWFEAPHDSCSNAPDDLAVSLTYLCPGTVCLVPSTQACPHAQNPTEY